MNVQLVTIVLLGLNPKFLVQLVHIVHQKVKSKQFVQMGSIVQTKELKFNALKDIIVQLEVQDLLFVLRDHIVHLEVTLQNLVQLVHTAQKRVSQIHQVLQGFTVKIRKIYSSVHRDTIVYKVVHHLNLAQLVITV